MTTDRRTVLQMLGASVCMSSFAGRSRAATSASQGAAADFCTAKNFRAPLDHSKSGGSTIELSYVQVGRFIPSRRTVFMLGDGQQFYIRADALGRFRSVFGPDVNIIGIPGRGSSKDLLSHLGSAQSVDWAEAYQLLRYEQWTSDADLLRSQLLGKTSKVLIYGESGGGRLAHEYMITHGANAAGVCTESAVFEPIEGEIGVQADEFWRQLSSDERRDLGEALKQRPQQRDFYAQLLQRQNYFVDLANLSAERNQLIKAIFQNDDAALQSYATKYEVAGLAQLLNTPQSYEIRVREYELIYPLLSGPTASVEFNPDHVVSEMWARPLLDLHGAGKIPAPKDDISRLNACQADALVIAGRFDHVADYRVSIALAAHYPKGRLLLMKDDHQMHNLTAEKKQLRNKLVQGWAKGFDSPDFRSAWVEADALRWRETSTG